MLPSEVPSLTTDWPVSLSCFLFLKNKCSCLETSLFFKAPWEGSLSLPLLSLFLSFIFFPASFERQWAAFLGA